MKRVLSIGLFAALAVMLLFSLSDANANERWCNAGILVCGDVIDSTTAQGHDDVSLFNCTGSERFYGNAHVYRVSHPGGMIWVTLDWEGDAEADSALHLFILSSCNANACIDHDPSYLEANWPADDYWIIVEGRRNAADGTPYVLRVFCGDNPLPVELLSFTGVAVDRGVALQWSTASETDNDHFEIERSAAGSSDWELIANVPASNSASGQHYDYLDADVAAGTWDYRLSSVDVTGAREELGTAVVTAAPTSSVVAAELELIGSYPNPFNPATTIKFTVGEATDIELAVFDLQGRLVTSLAQGNYTRGSYEVTFDGAGLASGVYFARLTSPQKSQMMKLVLMK
jgi:hypothetical protein